MASVCPRTGKKRVVLGLRAFQWRTGNRFAGTMENEALVGTTSSLPSQVLARVSSGAPPRAWRRGDAFPRCPLDKEQKERSPDG